MAEALSSPVPVREITAETPGQLPADVADGDLPVLLRGFVDHWPVVQAAKTSHQALHNYLKEYDKGAVVPVSAGSPSLDGRVFYNTSFTGFNAERGNAPLGEVLDRVLSHVEDTRPPLIYLASSGVDQTLPGFRTENDIDVGAPQPLASVWIGLRSRIAAHNDLPRNVACVAAGKRRFTLFPPNQTPNLYPGPFELTPAGRPISLVDFHKPDLEQFPLFKNAMETAQVAEMEAGDALFIPSMWWHHVEAFGGYNVLVNYWWRTVPSFMGTPQDVLNHALLTIRDMPPTEREVWKHLFDHYVFGSGEETTQYIPEHARGILGPMDQETARRTRAFLLNRLNR